MKQIILLLTILEFTQLVIDGFMEENSPAPSNKKDISSLQYRILFKIHIHYFSLFFIYTGDFQAPPEKNHPHPKCEFQPKISI